MLKALNFHVVALNIRNIPTWLYMSLVGFMLFRVYYIIPYWTLQQRTCRFCWFPSLGGRNSIAILESPTISGGLPVIPINDGVVQKKSLDQIGYDEVTLSNKSNVKN